MKHEVAEGSVLPEGNRSICDILTQFHKQYHMQIQFSVPLASQVRTSIAIRSHGNPFRIISS